MPEDDVQVIDANTPSTATVADDPYDGLPGSDATEVSKTDYEFAEMDGPPDVADAKTEDAKEEKPVEAKVEEPLVPQPRYTEDDLALLGASVGATPDAVRAHVKQYGLKATADAIAARMAQGYSPSAQPASGDAKPARNFKIDLPTGTDEGQYDEKLVASINAQLDAMNQHYSSLYADHQQKLSQQESFVNRMQQAIADAEENYRQQEFDRKIASLGEEYSELLGKGSGLSMDPKTAQYKNRVRVYQAMKRLGSESGNDPRSASGDDAFEKALHAELYKELADITRKSINGKVQARGRQAVGRPNGRSTSSIPLTPEQRDAKILEGLREMRAKAR